MDRNSQNIDARNFPVHLTFLVLLIVYLGLKYMFFFSQPVEAEGLTPKRLGATFGHLLLWTFSYSICIAAVRKGIASALAALVLVLGIFVYTPLGWLALLIQFFIYRWERKKTRVKHKFPGPMSIVFGGLLLGIALVGVDYTLYSRAVAQAEASLFTSIPERQFSEFDKKILLKMNETYRKLPDLISRPGEIKNNSRIIPSGELIGSVFQSRILPIFDSMAVPPTLSKNELQGRYVRYDLPVRAIVNFESSGKFEYIAYDLKDIDASKSIFKLSGHFDVRENNLVWNYEGNSDANRIILWSGSHFVLDEGDSEISFWHRLN